MKLNKRNIESLETDIEKLKNINNKTENLLLKPKEDIIKYANEIRNKICYEMLADISVDEINRSKIGIRVQLLKDCGIYTIQDLVGIKERQIAGIYGIGINMARTIKIKANEIINATLTNVKIKLSIDNQDEDYLNLLKAIYSYQISSSYQKELKTSRDEILSNLVVPKVLIKYKSFLERLFMARKMKDAAINSYKRLSDYVISEDVKRNISLNKEIRNELNISYEDAKRAYNTNPIKFINTLEHIMPELVSKNDYKEGLPTELAEEIEAEEFNPNGLKCVLRNYQLYGVKYILHQQRVLLGDEMGLGKTIQAIAVMVSLRNSGKTHFMVVCPLSVLTNWIREIEKHSDLKAYKIHGQGRIDSYKAWLDEGGVGVTTYETTKVLACKYEYRADLLVVDEAHYIKNIYAARSASVRSLAYETPRLLFMTGTPIENRVEEMISLIKVLNPKIARVLESEEYLTFASKFKKVIAPVYYRRKKEDVVKELPELIINEEWCELNSIEKEKYKEALNSRNQHNVRKISFNVDDLKDSTKMKRILEIVEEARNEDRKVLIFSNYLKTIEKIEEYLGDICYGPITGAVNPEMRQLMIDDFKEAEGGSVLLSQIISGGTGLNIQAASIVIICEPQLKPSIENQAIARTHRMGQTRNVVVYKMLVVDSIEERMNDILKNKQKIFDDYADESVAASNDTLMIDETTMKKLIDEERARYE